jgi:amidase
MPDDPRSSSAINRRQFLQSVAITGAGFSATSPDRESPDTRQGGAHELDEITIGALQEGMREGRFTARSLTETYLQRIEQMDRAGPTLRAFIELNPDALSIAGSLDAERRRGRLRGPLHGIPVVLKDVVDTADRMHTTAGSFALGGSFAPRDAFVAERLRAAGAVILGKTNMSEWSNARSTRATSGWSARGGLTKNPYVLDRTACGSSSGSAVAVSANLAAVAIGVGTDGSISCPASASGIVGVKPTVGLVSRAGLIPVSYSQDSAGPMARTVTDAAILLGVIAGRDARDPATAASAGRHDYANGLSPRALEGSRIGVIRQEEPDAALAAAFETALDIMRSAGAIIVQEFEVPWIEELRRLETTVLLCEFKDAIREYLATRGRDERHRTLADLIRFNLENEETEMQWFGQEWFEAAEETNGRASPEYAPALADCRRLARSEGLDRMLAGNRLDAFVAPSSSPAFATDLVLGDRPIGRNSSLSAVAGYPRVTVPAAMIHGLPVGISLMGGPWSEARLLALAYAFEQAARIRRPPRFLPTASFSR